MRKLTDLSKEAALKDAGLERIMNQIKESKGTIVVTVDEKDGVHIVQFRGRCSTATFTGAICMAASSVMRDINMTSMEGPPE